MQTTKNWNPKFFKGILMILNKNILHKYLRKYINNLKNQTEWKIVHYNKNMFILNLIAQGKGYLSLKMCHY